ncbi:hypothetical protein AB0D97_14160 [Streptomyces roseus]|uniref:hypothetical protein n=1 Tax=Streptomyces roseus TaxID=66430 RepID=UPI0033CAFD30
MAKITATATYTVELTGPELELIRRALKLVRDFGDTDDWDPADDLRTELGERG